MSAETYKILFVCTGNICRSPTAEAVFRHMVAQKGFDSVFLTDSAGTHGYHIGEPPDSRSIAAALRRRVDMTALRARQACTADFEEFDLIVAMDRGHYDRLRAMDTGARAEIRLFLDFCPGREGCDVPDPYYEAERAFDEVYDLIEQGAQALLEDLIGRKIR